MILTCGLLLLLQEYYDLDESKKSYVMRRCGVLLRNFKSKMYQMFVKPHLHNPEKLRNVSKKYRALVCQDDWDEFVKVRDSIDFKVTKFHC